MRLSLYLYTALADGVPATPTDHLARLDEQVARASARGFTGVWVAEHHVAPGWFPPPWQLLTWMAARHPTLDVGTNITIAPLHHPLHLASWVQTMTAMTAGAVRCGLGAGFRDREFNAFGVPIDDRFTDLRETGRALRALWEGTTVDLAGSWSGSGLQLAATARFRAPTLLWAARSSRGARVGSRVADALLPNPMGGFAAQLRLLDEFDELRGRPADMRPAVCDVVVADDAREARRRAAVRLGAEFASFRHWRSEVADIDAFARDPAREVERIRAYALVGDRDEVAATLAELAEAGVTELIVRVQQLGTEQREALDAIDLLHDAISS